MICVRFSQSTFNTAEFFKETKFFKKLHSFYFGLSDHPHTHNKKKKAFLLEVFPIFLPLKAAAINTTISPRDTLTDGYRTAGVLLPCQSI